MNTDETISMEEYRVVAIPGAGVYVVDEDDHCWCVGGDSQDTQSDNKLEADYAALVYGDSS